MLIQAACIFQPLVHAFSATHALVECGYIGLIDLIVMAIVTGYIQDSFQSAGTV